MPNSNRVLRVKRQGLPKRQKRKKTLTVVNLVCRDKLFGVKRRASSLAFKKAIKEQVWTLVRAQSACALALKRSRAAVKARDDRLGRTRERKKHPRAGKTRRDRRRGRGYLRATYTAKEYARDDRRVVSAVTPQKRRSASARPIPMLGYHLKGNKNVCNKNEYYKSIHSIYYYQ